MHLRTATILLPWSKMPDAAVANKILLLAPWLGASASAGE